MASKESEKQMIKVLQDLLRQVQQYRTAAAKSCAQYLNIQRHFPLQLYEVETIAGDFNQPNSQDLLLARL